MDFGGDCELTVVESEAQLHAAISWIEGRNLRK
jgi:hypothetical protein